MDPRLLKLYEAEMLHIRELGAEFAREFPKIAGRLGLDDFDCVDPYVERLLEGFAFLAARVQLKMDSEFPTLVQNLLEVVYPQVLAPTPSMAVVQFQPDLMEGDLAEGFPIPRNTALRARLIKGEQTACEFRTAHDLRLWPLEVVDMEYFSRDVVTLELPDQVRHAAAGLRIRLRVASGHEFSALSIDRLPIYLRGREELPIVLYEQLMAHSMAVLVRPTEGQAWHSVIDADHVQPMGFEPEQALIPYEHASFQGYRLLTEYFLFRERFLFVELCGIGPAIRSCDDREIDVIVLFNEATHGLSNSVNAETAVLHCTPAINLFPKRTDPIKVDRRRSEHIVIPDRIRPLDLEIFRIKRVLGINSDGREREFHPFYSMTDHTSSDDRPYYAVRRTPRVISSKQKRLGTRTSYLGSDAYISLVDRKNAPFSGDLDILSIEASCTNRDLPLQMSVGQGSTDFTLESGAPVNSIRCIAGPTRPRPSLAHAPGEMIWKFVSHLSLNYLSINDAQGTSLKEMLRLYADANDVIALKQIDGIKSLECESIIRQLPTSGPLTFGRGLRLTLTLEEEAFEGVGVYLLPAVLETFFAKYTSINSFTETVLKTDQRHEVARWPARIGRRHIL